MSRAFFITGTDTGVGKTRIACALLAAARKRGLDTLGLKPVAAGCIERDGNQVNEDAWELQQLAGTPRSYDTVNPVALREAIAPHIAAEGEGRALDAETLARHCRALIPTADFTVIEGAGGWLVPLNAGETMASVAQSLGAPVILVVGLRLGCINHTLLTAAAIRQSGLDLAGWVANRIDPEMPVADENIATLVARLPAPLLGTVPWMPEADAEALAAHLDLDALRETTRC